MILTLSEETIKDNLSMLRHLEESKRPDVLTVTIKLYYHWHVVHNCCFPEGIVDFFGGIALIVTLASFKRT